MDPTATTSPSLSPARDPSAYGPQGRSLWLDVDWREHQRWVILDGQPVNVIEIGEGPPLVFVHGLSGSWTNWLEQLPVFAGLNGDARQGRVSTGFGNHRVLALDLPGFGHSPMPAEQISISGYARLLDQLLGMLEIDAAAVVGNSMGGFVAAELAIAFPQRVERLVLVSAAGISTFGNRGGLRAVPVLQRVERIVEAYTAWMASKSDTVTRRPRLREATLNVVARHPSRLGGPLAAELLRGAGKPGFIQALAANLDYDFRERLPEIACPTLIVWGDSDRVITVRDAEVFAELIPDSRKIVFEDTGHIAMIERPAAFNSLLKGFLAE